MKIKKARENLRQKIIGCYASHTKMEPKGQDIKLKGPAVRINDEIEVLNENEPDHVGNNDEIAALNKEEGGDEEVSIASLRASMESLKKMQETFKDADFKTATPTDAELDTSNTEDGGSALNSLDVIKAQEEDDSAIDKNPDPISEGNLGADDENVPSAEIGSGDVISKDDSKVASTAAGAKKKIPRSAIRNEKGKIKTDGSEGSQATIESMMMNAAQVVRKKTAEDIEEAKNIMEMAIRDALRRYDHTTVSYIKGEAEKINTGLRSQMKDQEAYHEEKLLYVADSMHEKISSLEDRVQQQAMQINVLSHAIEANSHALGVEQERRLKLQNCVDDLLSLYSKSSQSSSTSATSQGNSSSAISRQEEKASPESEVKQPQVSKVEHQSEIQRNKAMQLFQEKLNKAWSNPTESGSGGSGGDKPVQKGLSASAKSFQNNTETGKLPQVGNSDASSEDERAKMIRYLEKRMPSVIWEERNLKFIQRYYNFEVENAKKRK